MGTFDSLDRATPNENFQSELKAPGGITALSTDLARLSPIENRNLTAAPSVSDGLHKLEIAGAIIGSGALAGGAVGAGMGLAAEGMVQTLKYPLAIGLEAFGARGLGASMLNMESQYMSAAGKFGAKGVAIGAAVGLIAYGGYEVKNYFDK